MDASAEASARVSDLGRGLIAPLYLHLSERDDLSGEEIEFFKRQLEKREGP